MTALGEGPVEGSPQGNERRSLTRRPSPVAVRRVVGLRVVGFAAWRVTRREGLRASPETVRRPLWLESLRY